MSIHRVQIIEKVWGCEEIIANNDLYCGKRMLLKEGFYCSVHCHRIKTETFYMVSGQLRMEVWQENNETLEYAARELVEGDCVDLLPGTWHRFHGLTNCEFMEFSTHHSDEDVDRLMPSGQGTPPKLILG